MNRRKRNLLRRSGWERKGYDWWNMLYPLAINEIEAKLSDKTHDCCHVNFLFLFQTSWLCCLGGRQLYPRDKSLFRGRVLTKRAAQSTMKPVKCHRVFYVKKYLWDSSVTQLIQISVENCKSLIRRILIRLSSTE